MHRQNLHQLPEIIQMAVDLDADRLEVANVQYYGWALKNRAALMPTLAQIEETSRLVEEAQVRLKGQLTIDYVVPDYYALRPKKCMGGWGRQFFNISPAGKVLPCHAAEAADALDIYLVAVADSELLRCQRLKWIGAPRFAGIGVRRHSRRSPKHRTPRCRRRNCGRGSG